MKKVLILLFILVNSLLFGCDLVHKHIYIDGICDYLVENGVDLYDRADVTDIKTINEDYSVEEYQSNIRRVISEETSRGKLPIIVGGTGLYVKAALYDYTFQKETISNKDVEELYKDKTNDELYEILLSLDPKSAESIHKNNRRRVLRAIAIYNATGKKKSDIIEEQKHELLYDALILSLNTDREILYDRINKRVDIMLENGLIDEIVSDFDQLF